MELDAPPPLPATGLRITPLGGLGAIGRNMTLFEFGGRLMVVDCGVLFPDVDQPGVDLILPDFESILDRLDQVDAIVLTHGHEDHIGAVPYLLAHKPDIPLVGRSSRWPWWRRSSPSGASTPYSLTVREGQTERLGPFECEFFAVNHSIPDALAVAITTPAGTVLHTGDFKMDQLPLDGRLTDLAGFARLGARGVDLLLSDSTNAEIPGFVTPGAGDRPGARPRSSPRPGAGSSWRRSRPTCTGCSRCWTAHEHDRRVAFIGRSMVRNMGIARDLGLLRIPAGLVVGMDEALTLPPEGIVLMSTGSQGEPMSALGRMATGDHRHVTVAPGDTVVLASSLVPGNETAVYRVINQLSRAGAVGGAQGCRQGARCPGTRRPVSCGTCWVWSSRATSCRCTGSGATCGRTPNWPSSPACRATAWCSARTATWSTSSTAWPATSGTCGPGTCTSTGWRSAMSASRCSPSGASSVTAASSPRPS
jgi:ribonuclease J